MGIKNKSKSKQKDRSACRAVLRDVPSSFKKRLSLKQLLRLRPFRPVALRPGFPQIECSLRSGPRRAFPVDKAGDQC